MEKKKSSKIEVSIGTFLCLVIILFGWRWALANQTQSENKDNLPFCQSKDDINKYAGGLVKLVGVYKHTNAGKCWVAKVLLRDASVIIEYQPPLEEVEKFDNKNVIVIGKILKEHPEDDPNHIRQWLLSPHLVDIQSIKEYPSSLQGENVTPPAPK